MAKKTLSFIPQVMDLKLYAGDGCGFRFTVTNSAGAAIPITGEMKAQIRATREAVDPALVDFDTDLTEADDGIVLVSVTGVQTHSLISGDEKFEGVWDLQWTPDSSEPITLVQGDVECYPDVTH